MYANALTTIDAAVTLTSKLRANVGIAGATMPKPTAITKLTTTSTQTSLSNRGATGAAAEGGSSPAPTQHHPFRSSWPL